MYNMTWLYAIHCSSASTGIKSEINKRPTSVGKVKTFDKYVRTKKKKNPGAEALGMKEEHQVLLPFNEFANSHLKWQHSVSV